MNLVKTSYSQDDAKVLLKDLSGLMQPMSPNERAEAMQNGVHYSEMLPMEEPPTNEYFNLYNQSLERSAAVIADYVRYLACSIKDSVSMGKPVLVSLARAGTPVGILIKRYLKQYFALDCPHYTISIIRDKGIDINAMEYIYTTEFSNGDNGVENVFFIDGWTGKGAIQHQLTRAVLDLKESDTKWEALHDWLYVLADPACITPYSATCDDILLPSACLNSTVSGLISRSILNKYIDVKHGDFHGAVYFQQFSSIDCSNAFIDRITSCFKPPCGGVMPKPAIDFTCAAIVSAVCKAFDVDDYLKVKPGIGETTRVLLRRVPYKVLVNKSTDLADPDIAHILELCNRKKVPIERFDLGNYKVCGIVREGKADT